MLISDSKGMLITDCNSSIFKLLFSAYSIWFNVDNMFSKIIWLVSVKPELSTKYEYLFKLSTINPALASPDFIRFSASSLLFTIVQFELGNAVSRTLLSLIILLVIKVFLKLHFPTQIGL